ncbi:hypothetical protein BN8_p06892 (plasmid) [Fibrisoma limi BUZ 3]|uniref:CBM6 domain-containing protein n=1 Tax=Fibrisoma limi BUZ 3 TaxID=1185876 RepID=I2GU82_9BACT|nr:carbohydrate-binding protein [Fibrisoma limi]CCH57683.1 hypothetical protein BN8_p06892 [Fibrisoma limi BUZ 3]
MRSIIRYVFSVLLLLAGVSTALADCPKYNTLPRAREGAVGYDKTEKCIFLCDGNQWQTQCPTVTNPGCTGICVPGSDPIPFNVCFEAEDPANTGVSSIVNTTTPPGGKMRSSFGNTSEYLDFAPFNIPEAAYYTLDIYYASAENPSAGITPNGGTLQTLYLGTSYVQNQYDSWFKVAKKSINIPLKQGSNNLRVAGTNSGGAFSLDKICIRNGAASEPWQPNVGICTAPEPDWVADEWSECFADCGNQGYRYRSYSCSETTGTSTTTYTCPTGGCAGSKPANTTSSCTKTCTSSQPGEDEEECTRTCGPAHCQFDQAGVNLNLASCYNGGTYICGSTAQSPGVKNHSGYYAPVTGFYGCYSHACKLVNSGHDITGRQCYISISTGDEGTVQEDCSCQ